MLKVRLVRARRGEAPGHRRARRGGRVLGEIEEYFIETLVAGRHLRVRRRGAALRGLRETEVYVSRANADGPEGAVLRWAASFRSRPISPSGCAACSPTRRTGRALPDQVRDWLRAAAAACRVLPRPRRAAGRDLPARRQALPRLLSVRGPARAPDARHAADAAAGARARCGRSASSPTNMRWRSGGWATWRALIAQRRARRSTRCSTRTCWATISRPGWPNPR